MLIQLTFLSIFLFFTKAQLFDLNEERFSASDTKRVVSLTLDCVCSPTNRDVLAGAKTEIGQAIQKSNADQPRLDAFEACVNKYSYEDCINADASFRSRNDKPVVDSLCSYVKPSGRNIVDAGKGQVRTVARCDMVVQTAATNITDIDNGQAEVDEAGGLKEDKNGEVPGAPKARLHEGCVAVEHLRGYRLQHTKHLTAAVLCAGKFCATHNHAIIVDGQWTSMKRLCATKWVCVETTKLVNNLDVFATRRVRVDSDIIVTPYDARFPRFGVWVVQFVGHLIHFLLNVSGSLFVAVVTAFLFLYGRRPTWCSN